MTKEQEKIETVPFREDEFMIPAFGYELIREFLLDDLLGKEGPQLLYWAGKQLGRRFPLSDTNEIISFFQAAGWGELELLKDTKQETKWELSGRMIERRYSINEDSVHFQLEAGFLAYQLGHQKKVVTEAYEEQKKKGRKVLFTVKSDVKDPVALL